MRVSYARVLQIGMKLLACALLLISLKCSERLTIALCATGLVIFMASLVIEFAFHRCPHCGRLLNRNYWGEYCQHCGNSLTEEK